VTMSARADLLAYVTALGDDALVLGQRLCEWVSRAPTLEEELALGNVALDHIGRARAFYRYAARLADDGRSEDDFAYRRDCRDFMNLLITELPRGDFAFTTVRQFLIDAFNVPFMAALAQCAETELAVIGARSLAESQYHLRRSRDWMLRLGDGTEESRGRVQRALEALSGYTAELFEPAAAERRLIDAGSVPERRALEAPWRATVAAVLREATLTEPSGVWRVAGGRDGIHTEHLGHLLAELQFVQRAYPGLSW
jgi:ring-1,2-phenylacetyl-CoA epoxidase subunit PaaC